MASPAEGGADPNTKKDIVLTSTPIETFADLALIEPLHRALIADGYKKPTPIQQQAIPILLEGRDMIGCAQTGTGKTAAFALPLLQSLYHEPKAVSTKCARILVLSPTRELAGQIHDSFGAYGRYINVRRTTIFGGVSSQGQIKAMARGVDVLVATPGRLLDLINQGRVCLDEVDAFVLDEADRMLDMGFIPDIRKIAAKLPTDRQTLLFSATMAPGVTKLANTLLRNPMRVDIAPESTTADTVKQEIMFVDRPAKVKTLLELLDNGIYKAIVFTRTKHGANRLDGQLHKGGVKAVAIHGNKSQNARKKALEAFQNGHLQVLVATDVAARGLDIDDVTHVINYDMPDQPDAYVHRIGRTGRAGNEGIAISLCDSSERHLLRDIERLIGKSLTGGAAPPPMKQGHNDGPSAGKGFNKKKPFKSHRKGPKSGEKKPWQASESGKPSGDRKTEAGGEAKQKRRRRRSRPGQPQIKREAA
ncbi:MAG: DEAD/DEAH box helicase [Rhodospirillaceae bacterium]|nr:DEAD/DEAH box helicase [Rhodospirillaceae bacterium]